MTCGEAEWRAKLKIGPTFQLADSRPKTQAAHDLRLSLVEQRHWRAGITGGAGTTGSGSGSSGEAVAATAQ
jgi:hypothetical protein